MSDPLFIDECLSLALVAKAHSRGHHATHVAFMGLRGEQDWNLIPMLLKNNFVLVTNNGEEFKMRYASLELHPGLIIIVPGGIGKERQVELFDLALEAFESMTDLVNKVMSINIDGSLTIVDIPNPNACQVCNSIPCICSGSRKPNAL